MKQRQSGGAGPRATTPVSARVARGSSRQQGGAGDVGLRPSTVAGGARRGGDGEEVQWRAPAYVPGSAAPTGRGGGGRKKSVASMYTVGTLRPSTSGSLRPSTSGSLRPSTSGTLRPSTSGRFSMNGGTSSAFSEPMHPGESAAHLSKVYGSTVRWDYHNKSGQRKLEKQLNARTDLEKVLAPDRVFAPYFGDGTDGLTPLNVPGEGAIFIPLNTVDPDAWKGRVEELVRQRLTTIRHMEWWEPPKTYKVAREGGEGPRKSPSPTKRSARKPRGHGQGRPSGKKKAFQPRERPAPILVRTSGSPLPSRMHPTFLMGIQPSPGKERGHARVSVTPAKARPASTRVAGPKNLSFYSEIQSKAVKAPKGKAATMYGKSFESEHADDRRLPVFEYDRYEIRPGPSFHLELDGSPRSSRNTSPGGSRPSSVRGGDEESDLMRKLFEDEYREMDAAHRQRHLRAVLLMQARLRGKLERIRARLAGNGQSEASRILSAHYSTPGKERASRIKVISKIQRQMRKKASAAREMIASSKGSAIAHNDRIKSMYAEYGL